MAPDSRDIPHQTLAGQVQDHIREAIVQRELQPGGRIDQAKLADDLRVSLVPVREALKSLEAEGLVKIIPRRGAFVTEVSREHLDDLYFARQVIEGEATFYAVPKLTKRQLNTLHNLIDDMECATTKHDLKAFMDWNRQFHMQIYEAVHNQHLLQIIIGLWERSELYRYRYMFVIHNADTVHAEHRAILAACENQDANQARALAIQHIRHTQHGLHQEIDAEHQQDTP